VERCELEQCSGTSFYRSQGGRRGGAQGGGGAPAGAGIKAQWSFGATIRGSGGEGVRECVPAH
jgi:hypothetical protein